MCGGRGSCWNARFHGTAWGLDQKQKQSLKERQCIAEVLSLDRVFSWYPLVLNLWLLSWAFLAKSSAKSHICLSLWNWPKQILSIKQGGWKLSALRMVLRSVDFLNIEVCKSPLTSSEIFRSRKLISDEEKSRLSFKCLLVLFKYEWNWKSSVSELGHGRIISSICLSHHIILSN